MPGIAVPEPLLRPLRESWSPVVGIAVPEAVVRPATVRVEIGVVESAEKLDFGFPSLRGPGPRRRR